MKKLLVICITALFAGCHTNVDLEQQVDELYAKMSQEERIAQLRSMYMDELFDEQGKLDTAKCRQLIPYGIGHFSQFCMQQPREPQVLRDRAIAIQDWIVQSRTGETEDAPDEYRIEEVGWYLRPFTHGGCMSYAQFQPSGRVVR